MAYGVNRRFSSCPICGMPKMGCPHRMRGGRQPSVPIGYVPPKVAAKIDAIRRRRPQPLRSSTPTTPTTGRGKLERFIVDQMSVAEINSLLILIARSRGATFNAKKNPRPYVRPFLDQHVDDATAGTYLRALQDRKRAGKPLIQRPIH